MLEADAWCWTIIPDACHWVQLHLAHLVSEEPTALCLKGGLHRDTITFLCHYKHTGCTGPQAAVWLKMSSIYFC